MRVPFVLVGLSGTGKSTTFREVSRILQDPSPELLETDAIILERISREDRVVQQFVKQCATRHEKDPSLYKHKIIDMSVFDDAYTCFSKIAAQYGAEPYMRDLEELYIIDIVKNYNLDNACLDIGGKAFFREASRKAFAEKGMLSVFLYGDENVSLKHLLDSGDWKKNSLYRDAGEGKWQAVALKQRTERLPFMLENTQLLIDVTGKDELSVAKEVLYEVRAFQLRAEEVKEGQCIGR